MQKQFVLKRFGFASGYAWAILVYIMFLATICLLVLVNLVAPVVIEFVFPAIQVLIMGIYYLATSVQFLFSPINWQDSILNSIVGFVAQLILVILLLLLIAHLLSRIPSTKLRWAIAFLLGLWLFSLPALALIKLISFFVWLNVDALDFWSI